MGQWRARGGVSSHHGGTPAQVSGGLPVLALRPTHPPQGEAQSWPQPGLLQAACIPTEAQPQAGAPLGVPEVGKVAEPGGPPHTALRETLSLPGEHLGTERERLREYGPHCHCHPQVKGPGGGGRQSFPKPGPTPRTPPSAAWTLILGHLHLCSSTARDVPPMGTRPRPGAPPAQHGARHFQHTS